MTLDVLNSSSGLFKVSFTVFIQSDEKITFGKKTGMSQLLPEIVSLKAAILSSTFISQIDSCVLNFTVVLPCALAYVRKARTS